MPKRALLPLTHAILIVASYLSPLFIPWRIILLFILLYYLQLAVFGGCVLTKAELGSSGETFYEHYFSKIGIKTNRAKINFVVDRVIPPLLLLAAFVYQNYLR